ncbi:ribonuclease J [Candidatus Parcubacteria bacterium]|nr:ribonuclease J [Patescibacteria group bacterium]MBU4476874.1 ribonuclease J [Patescibacteria group bacterium]MCG2699147.1 ribonuclease J [Candidatus Parcubacteria bacterium]
MMEKHTTGEMPIRIIPLGGVEEIGRNMTIIECGNDIVVIDAGLEFPVEETPGIDYIIPNTKYLESRKHKIRALIISHGHLDHTGAIPYIMDMIGNPTIYTTKLTKAMILRKQEEFPHAAKLRIEEVRSGDKIKLGALAARFFDITHTIPDAIGIIIETHIGNIIYPGDFKIETDAKGNPLQIDSYVKIGKENNLALLLESTNAEVPGFSIPEKTVQRNLEKIISEAKGRVITGTFSSLLERIIELIKIAEKYDRKVVIDGFSMKTNVEIAKELGYFKPKENAIISVERINDYPPEKILAICTGAQGEENAALMRIANRRHKHIKIQKEDTIVLSSSVIPGNERSIQNLKDNLARQGAKIIHYKVADVHASGHAYQEELKMMTKMINPKFLIPIHGYYFMLKNNADLAESIGMRAENIVPPLRNGSIIEVAKNKIRTLKESAPANYVMVDGLGVNDVKEVVLRDRQMLAQDGIFVIITVIDSQTGKVKNSPDIISRGFIYLRESQELLKQTRQLIKKTVEDATGKMHPINVTYVKDLLKERVGKFLFQKTKRRPMVLPVLLEV